MLSLISVSTSYVFVFYNPAYSLVVRFVMNAEIAIIFPSRPFSIIEKSKTSMRVSRNHIVSGIEANKNFGKLSSLSDRNMSTFKLLQKKYDLFRCFIRK